MHLYSVWESLAMFFGYVWVSLAHGLGVSCITHCMVFLPACMVCLPAWSFVWVIACCSSIGFGLLTLPFSRCLLMAWPRLSKRSGSEWGRIHWSKLWILSAPINSFLRSRGFAASMLWWGPSREVGWDGVHLRRYLISPHGLCSFLLCVVFADCLHGLCI